MATRAYRRNSRGQFAGASGGTKVTYGKAGGFANPAFRARVQANRGNARPKKADGGFKMRAARAGRAVKGGAIKAVKNRDVQKLAVGGTLYLATNIATDRAMNNMVREARANPIVAQKRGLPSPLTPAKRSRMSKAYNITSK